MVHTGYFVVVGDSKWKVIGETRYENMEDFDGFGVYGFYFDEPDNIDSIELVN